MSLSAESLVVEADRCVACGLCLPHCPTYRKTGSEADSPRGRIQLMRAVTQNILPNNERFKEHIDLCLSCRSCESACPNSVNYGALVDAARGLHIQKKSIWYTLSKPFVRYRALQYIVSWLSYILQASKLDGLLKYLNPAASVLPTVPRPQIWKAFYPATQSRKGAVSLFLGCASNTFDQATLHAGTYVLNQLGYDVHVPPQTCCGSIARQMGDQPTSQALVAANQQAFDKALPLISMASGCGAALQDYLTEHSVKDISSFLLGCDWANVTVAPHVGQIYVQDPCTLRNVQKGQQAVYSLLKKIPQSEVLPLPGNAQCCGGAGAYMLTQGNMAKQLLDDKLATINATNALLLATSNIGCSLHIAQGLRAQHQQVVVKHPIQILAQQMGFSA